MSLIHQRAHRPSRAFGHGLLAALFFLWSAGTYAWAETSSGSAGPGPQVETAVREFLRSHPSLAERRHAFQFRSVQQRFPLCPTPLQVSLPHRDKPWGSVTLRIDCPAGTWSRGLGVVVRVDGRYLVAKRALNPGSVIQGDDVDWREGDLAASGQQRVEDLDSLKGLELVRPIGTGSPLRLNDFRPMTVIRSGDLVSLSLLGQGFEMITSGAALSDAALGATVRVKTLEGKILQGKAVAAGKVEALLD